MVCTVIWGVMTYCVLIDIFTIVPTTQYVWINQTATFTCATNVTGYELSFSVSGGVADVPTLMDLPGGGQLVTTSFTVTSDNNGTSVRCLAAYNGGLSVVSDPAGFAYGQGMEYIFSHSFISPPCHNTRSVVDLTAVQQECGIFISWKPPHLLPGLSVSYNVYINGEMNISTTNHTYYPMKLTNTTYNVTVKAFNDSIIGDATTIKALYQTSMNVQVSFIGIFIIIDQDVELTYLQEMTIRQAQSNIWKTYFIKVVALIFHVIFFNFRVLKPVILSPIPLRL